MWLSPGVVNGRAASQWDTDVADDPEAWSAMAGTRLRFGLLGPLLLTVAGTPVALGTPKQRAVLAMLLINRNRAVGTESLIDAAWDQSPVPAARDQHPLLRVQPAPTAGQRRGGSLRGVGQRTAGVSTQRR